MSTLGLSSQRRKSHIRFFSLHHRSLWVLLPRGRFGSDLEFMNHSLWYLPGTLQSRDSPLAATPCGARHQGVLGRAEGQAGSRVLLGRLSSESPRPCLGSFSFPTAAAPSQSNYWTHKPCLHLLFLRTGSLVYAVSAPSSTEEATLHSWIPGTLLYQVPPSKSSRRLDNLKFFD